jgi:hypothetical protein
MQLKKKQPQKGSIHLVDLFKNKNMQSHYQTQSRKNEMINFMYTSSALPLTRAGNANESFNAQYFFLWSHLTNLALKIRTLFYLIVVHISNSTRTFKMSNIYQTLKM